jgi:hypothetical protein
MTYTAAWLQALKGKSHIMPDRPPTLRILKSAGFPFGDLSTDRSCKLSIIILTTTKWLSNLAKAASAAHSSNGNSRASVLLPKHIIITVWIPHVKAGVE